MNQDDIIMLGEIIEEFGDNLPVNEEGKKLLQKVKIVSQQAKASKEYQELMDKLNNDLSDIGKDEENGKS